MAFQNKQTKKVDVWALKTKGMLSQTVTVTQHTATHADDHVDTVT